MKAQAKKSTNIERLMEEALRDGGWRYESQFVVPRVCIADFYLPDHNAMIFCDGDYWHKLPKNEGKDQRQTAALLGMGYAVYRFWGSAILTDLPSCVAQLPQG